MQKIRASEVLLIEIILYILLWFANDFLATMLTVIQAGLCFLVLLFSLVAEWIEKSNVPRWFFNILWVSIVAPLLAAAIYIGFTGGLPTWIYE